MYDFGYPKKLTLTDHYLFPSQYNYELSLYKETHTLILTNQIKLL